MKAILTLLFAVLLGACASAPPMVIQTHEVSVVPKPISMPQTPTTPYVVPADTALLPNGSILITPADTGFVAVDSSTGAKVAVKIHVRKNGPPTVTATIHPDTAHASLTDTASGKVTVETVNKPTFGQGLEIVLITLGAAAIVLIVLYLIGKLKI